MCCDFVGNKLKISSLITSVFLERALNTNQLLSQFQLLRVPNVDIFHNKMWKLGGSKKFWFYFSVTFGIYVLFLRPIVLTGNFDQKIEKATCKSVWFFMADFR